MREVIYTSVLMLLCAMAWGSVFPLAKQILQHMSGLSLSIWRFAIAVVGLFLFIKCVGKRLTTLSLRQYATLAAVGGLGVGGLNLALFEGLQHTSATNGALIMALSPIVTSLFSAGIERQSPDKAQVFKLVTAFFGVFLVVTNGDLSQFLALEFNRGDLTIALGMTAWSCYTVSSQKLSHWLPPMEFSLVTMSMGLSLLILTSLFKPSVHPIDEIAALPTHLLLSLIYIATFATVLGYIIWNHGVKVFGSSKASLYFNLVPVFAALVALLMGQEVTQVQLMGMVIVVSGLSLPALFTILITDSSKRAQTDH